MDSHAVPIAEGKPTVRSPQAGAGIRIPQPPHARAPDLFNASSTVGAGMEDLSRGARHLAESMRQRDEEDARAWTASQLSQTQLEWTQHLIDRQQSWTPGKGEPFTGKILSDFDEYQKKAVEAAPTDQAKYFLNERLTHFRTNIAEKAMTYEATANIDYRADQYAQGTDNAAKLMNTDPGQYKTVLAEQLAIIDSAKIPPVKKSELRQRAIDRISGAATWTEIQRSPSAFLASIGFNDGAKLPTLVASVSKNDAMTGPGAETPGAPKTRKSGGTVEGITGNTAFDALPFEMRTKMFDSAIRLKAQIESDGQRATTAQAKQVSDNAMKDAWDKFFGGKLKLEDIQAIKPLINDNDYKALREAHRKGPDARTRTDSATLRGILQMEDAGDYDGARNAAYAAHRAGLLKDEGSDGLTGIIGRVSTLQRQGGPKTEYERSRSYIVQSLDPGPMVPDPIGKSRFAEALDTFDRWHSTPGVDGKKRTDKDVEDFAKDLVKRTKFVDLRDTIIALPSPRGTQIGRQVADPDRLRDDIISAANKLAEQRDSRRLSPQEYEREMETLNRWRKVHDGLPKKELK